jgi:shikimate kinase
MSQNITLVGLRSAGKSTIGCALAAKLNIKFIDADLAVEQLYHKQTGTLIPFRELHEKIGATNFRHLVSFAIKDLCTSNQNILIAAGGGSLLAQENVDYFKSCSKIVFLDASYELLLERWKKHPPKFIIQDKIEQELRDYYDKRRPLFNSLADVRVTVDNKNVQTIACEIVEKLSH